jgi:hypothetical protein
MALENSFTDIKRGSRAFLDSAIGEIKRSELGSNLCSMSQTYAGYSNVTETICHSVQNDVFGKGLSLAH